MAPVRYASRALRWPAVHGVREKRTLSTAAPDRGAGRPGGQLPATLRVLHARAAWDPSRAPHRGLPLHPGESGDEGDQLRAGEKREHGPTSANHGNTALVAPTMRRGEALSRWLYRLQAHAGADAYGAV